MKNIFCCPALELFQSTPVDNTVRLHAKKLQNATNNLLRPRKYIFRNLSAHIPMTVAVQIRDTQKDALHSSIVSVRKMSSVAKQ